MNLSVLFGIKTLLLSFLNFSDCMEQYCLMTPFSHKSLYAYSSSNQVVCGPCSKNFMEYPVLVQKYAMK